MRIEKLKNNKLFIEVNHNEEVYLDTDKSKDPINIRMLGNVLGSIETFNDGVNQLQPILQHGKHLLSGTKNWHMIIYKVIIHYSFTVSGNLGGMSI